MKTLSAALLVIVLALISACRSTGSHADSVVFHTLLRGYQSGLQEPTTRVVRSEVEWRELWKAHTAFVLPRPEVPEIDWADDMVIAVALGARNTLGYAVDVHDVRREKGKLVVDAVETRPALNAIVPTVVSHPYVFVTVPRFDGDVEFNVR